LNITAHLDYSARSDVWAAGIIVLEALLGEHPFPTRVHKSFFALNSAILGGKHPSPPDGTEPEIREFVEACLQANPPLATLPAPSCKAAYSAPKATSL
jgi:serine/threonine protein kinase